MQRKPGQFALHQPRHYWSWWPIQRQRMAPSLLSWHVKEDAGEIENPERTGREQMQLW